jgi:hypothetical protein
VLRAREDFTDHDLLEFGRAGGHDTLDLEAEKRNRPRDFVDGSVELDVVAEPVEGNFHLKA